MEANRLELALEAGDAPSGEIGLDELAAIAGSLQQLVTRVGRQVGDQQGPGRTADHVDRVTRLRLRGLRSGSTVLDVAYGEEGALPMDVGLEREIADRFWEIVAGIGANQRPAWAGPLVADSALALRDALARSAARVQVRRGGGEAIVIDTAQADREVWREVRRITDEVTVTGRLEAVDLKAKRFRIRDDVGNGVTLEAVDDAEQAGRLVGQRATAGGVGISDDKGRLVIRGARLVPSPLPTLWTVREADIDAMVAGATEPDARGLTDLTGEEADAFLDVIRQM